jgi:hypothetical protein
LTMKMRGLRGVPIQHTLCTQSGGSAA